MAGRHRRHMRAVAVGVGRAGAGQQLCQLIAELAAIDGCLQQGGHIQACGPAVATRCPAQRDEVHRCTHPRLAVAVLKVLVPEVDARVEDGNADTAPVQAAATGQCQQRGAGAAALL